MEKVLEFHPSFDENYLCAPNDNGSRVSLVTNIILRSIIDPQRTISSRPIIQRKSVLAITAIDNSRREGEIGDAVAGAQEIGGVVAAEGEGDGDRVEVLADDERADVNVLVLSQG